MLALTAALLTGCTGDGQVAAFERAFADDAAVRSLELTSHDNQPFTGGVSGEVFARDALSDADLTALADRVGVYTSQHRDEMRGVVSIVADGIEFAVTGDAADDADAVRWALAVRADERVRSAEVDATFVGMVGVDVEAAVGLLRDLDGLLAGGDRVPDVVVRSEDGAVSVRDDAAPGSGGHGGVARALAVWDALADGVPLSGMRLHDGQLVVTLRSEADLKRAQQRVASMPVEGDHSDDAEVWFASDLVRLGDSDGGRAREVIAALDADVAARIVYIWQSDARLQVTVRSAGDQDAVADAVEAVLPAGTTEASVAVEGEEGSSVDLRTR